MTENKRENYGKKRSAIENIIYDWIIPIISAFIIAALIHKFVLYKVYIPSGSMIPTLNIGDRLFVTRVYNVNNLQRGDIVVFYSEELQEDLIKRLIGLPGDKIEIKNGIVSVNGEILEEDYVESQDNFNGVYEVPEGKFFFLGDNRANSKDSRYWINPYIDGDDIAGKAQIKVYPFNDIGKLK